MDLAIVFTVFPIVFAGELPDKTMFASLLMATRGRPLAVWTGAAGAFVLHVAIAVAAGAAIVALLPHRAVDALVAAVFLLGALLALREARRADEGRARAHAHEQAGGRHRTIVTAFAVIFVAEWGDLTQVLTVDLAARYRAPLSVGLGALLALWAVSGLAVLGGRGISRLVSVTTIRYVTAGVLVVLAGLAAWQAAR